MLDGNNIKDIKNIYNIKSQKSFKRMIEEICEEENIKYNLLSKGWVIMLEKEGKTRFISGYKFDLNSHAIGLIADDKYALYDVLNKKDIPIIEHKIVYNKENKFDYAQGCNTYEYVKEYFMKNNKHIVIKPNSGTCGNDVYNVTSVDEIDNILDKIFIKNHSISICPFYNIKHEYRVIMLNGEAKIVYRKNLPRIYGRDNKTIRELLLEFNYDYFANKLQDSKYDKILASGEEYIYNWKYNLSQGSKARKLEDKVLEEKLEKIAKKVCKEINIRFGSIDIIETESNEILVLEVNSGVMVENYIKQNPEEYSVVKNVYKEAIESLFEQ